MTRPWATMLLLAGTLSCAHGAPATTPVAGPRAATTAFTEAPRWAADAIWYQVFVERFRNGDPRNDPTVHDIAGFTDRPVPPGWHVTPWTADWYKPDPWATAAGRTFYDEVQFRRYGGDLQGLLDQLDYLQHLGITALFINPINDAPSLHKYDARSYAHVDRNFGPDPRGDEARMAREDVADPRTWGWTAADSLFLRLVQEVHRRGMRIIVDYSWNHTGTNFPAWQDVLAHQRASRFADWYEVERFDDPATKDTNEFRYRGWAGVPSLPEWKKVGRPAGQNHGAIEGNMIPAVRDMIFAVSRRWLDPNGDGNPADGIDGFRLDVADVIPLGFWRDYRRFVRGINPDAYLIGEIWWEHWPDKMYDPVPWLQGDVFDAVMHYQWYAPTARFFAGAPPQLQASAYAKALDSLQRGIRPSFQRALMNLTASHDTPRFATSILNARQNKYRESPRDDSTYDIGPATARSRATQVLVLAQQFTWVGAPNIWNGDEVGMWGADDPDPRKPIVWGDLTYDPEQADPFGRARPVTPVAPDTALLRTYRELIALRKEHLPLFATGTVTWLVTDDARGMLAYERLLGTQRAIVAFNVSDTPQTFSADAAGPWRQAWPTASGAPAMAAGITASLPARSARIWIRE